jgi:PKD repeat protein
MKKTILLISFMVFCLQVPFAQNYSLQFDSSGDYVYIDNPTNISFQGDMTLEAWLKWTPTTNYQAVISKRLNDNDAIAMGISTTGRLVYFNGMGRQYESTIEITENVWTHLAIVIDFNNDVTLYINGNNVGYYVGGFSVNNTAPLTFGVNYGGIPVSPVSAEWFYGNISEIRISNNKRYNSNFLPTVNLLNDDYTMGYWSFNEGSGSILNDTSGNDNHGTIIEATWSTDVPENSFVADFAASPTSGFIPLEVDFSDLSTPADFIITWHWDFGDGNESFEQNPTHTYTESGSFTVSLTITDSDNDSDTMTKENYITVTQNPNPVFQINPVSLNFGYTQLNSTKTLSVTVTNYGLADLTISNILPSTNRYSVSLPEKDLDFTLGSMESKLVNIHFTPNVLNIIAGQIIFFTNDPLNSMYSLPVTGIGAVPEIATETEEIDFGQVYLTSQSGDSLLVIQNTGLVDLTVQTLSFTENSGAFIFEYDELGNPIAPNETASIYVRFYPPTTGTFEDTLLLVNNSLNEPNLTISLSGTCIYAPPKEPENIDIVIGENNAVITWDAVTENIYGHSIVPDGYIVLYNEIPDDEDYFWFLAFVSAGETYTHLDVARFRSQMFYTVLAYIEQERGQLEQLLELSKTNEKQKWIEILKQ